MASRHPRPTPVAAGLQLQSHLHHGLSQAKPAKELLSAPVLLGRCQHDAGTATLAKPCERRRHQRGRVGRQEPSLIELAVGPKQDGPQRTKNQ